MRSFVSELADLHRLAVSTAVADFPAEVVGHLHRWIDFDGAVFGFGGPQDETLKIATATVFGRDDAILDEYADVSHEDPVTAAFLNRPAHPICVDAGAIYAGSRRQSVAKFARRHDLRHLLLFGDAPEGGSPMRWIVLYRGTDRAFGPQAVARFGAAWDHVSCSLDLNRAHASPRSTASGPRHALALVDADGSYQAVDPLFHDLVALEWPHADSLRLPPPALAALATGDAFHGSLISVTCRRLGARLVCEARRCSIARRLSPRERVVAHHYAAGLTHKEVARQVSSSPHTVRAQLAQVYRKLAVQDKTALVRCLAEEDGEAGVVSSARRLNPSRR